jgi:hypothetical protein
MPKGRQNTLLVVTGIVIGGISGFMLSHQMAVHHWFAPNETEKRDWISTISAAKSIAVTAVKDNKTIVIGSDDKRFKEIIDKTVHAIESKDHYPASMGPISVVVYRTADSRSIVAVYTGKHIIVQGYYFMTPYPFLELTYSAAAG